MDRFISLAEAARRCSTSSAYLKVLIHRGRLKAKKIGRNWVTTEKWLKGYSASRGGNSPVPSLPKRGEERSSEAELELQKLKLHYQHEENKLKIIADKEIRFKELELTKGVIARNEHDEAIPEIAAPPARNDDSDLSQLLSEEIGKQIELLQQEKRELAEFFTHQFQQLQAELESEQDSKQALLFELQHLRDQIEQSVQQRIEELAHEVNEKLQEKTFKNELSEEKPIAALPAPKEPPKPVEQELPVGSDLSRPSATLLKDGEGKRERSKLQIPKFKLPTFESLALPVMSLLLVLSASYISLNQHEIRKVGGKAWQNLVVAGNVIMAGVDGLNLPKVRIPEVNLVGLGIGETTREIKEMASVSGKELVETLKQLQTSLEIGHSPKVSGAFTDATQTIWQRISSFFSNSQEFLADSFFQARETIKEIVIERIPAQPHGR